MLPENQPPRIRAPRRGAKPTVSVVVASKGDGASLERCLSAIVPHCDRVGAEVIVARAGAGHEVAALGRAMPQVRFILAPNDTELGHLRALGMAEAEGDIVALVDDRDVVGPAWGDALARVTGEAGSGDDPEAAAEPAPVDWRAYFEKLGVL